MGFTAPIPAPLFDRSLTDRAFVPTMACLAVARSGGPGRPSGRRASALPWRVASPAAGFRRLGTTALLIGVTLAASPVRAQAGRTQAADVAGLSAVVADAARRFGLPAGWISAVMRAESGLDPHARSVAGAMGLMQLMPATYSELSARYGLGGDPYQMRDNVFAGAAYLREMYDRFGASGMLAAYNAGPTRYAAYLVGASRLPRETAAYVAHLAPRMGTTAGPPAASAPPSLFVAVHGNWRASSDGFSAADRGLFVADGTTGEAR
jgi:hypothetical protein